MFEASRCVFQRKKPAIGFNGRAGWRGTDVLERGICINAVALSRSRHRP
jgi:hypothetical protein